MTMHLRISRVAVVSVVGAGLVIAAGGVGYAAASSSGTTLTACASAKGVLALQSKGKCPAGYKAVSINKQGAKGAKGSKGATGATGSQGIQGPQGPGAVAYDESTLGSGSGTTKKITVDGFSYSGNCIANGTGTSRTVTARFFVTPPTGVEASIVTLYGVTVNGGAPTSNAYRSDVSDSTQSFFVSASNTDTRTIYNPALQVIGSNGKIQVLSINITAKAADSGALNIPCTFTGTITPASSS